MNAHENAGVIVKAGQGFLDRHGVEEGELVALEEYLPCGHCEWCRIGRVQALLAHRHAQQPQPPAGWTAAFRQYLYLPPNVVLHKVPQTMTADEAALALPVGNGVQWACKEAEAGPGKTIVVQGPGSKGLGSTLAAKKFGATVIVTGLSKDTARLEAAKRLGADHTIDVQTNDFTSTIMDITNGRGADAVVDCTTGRNTVIFNQAIDVLVRRGGIVVTQAYELESFSLERLTGKYGQLRACRGPQLRERGDGPRNDRFGRIPPHGADDAPLPAGADRRGLPRLGWRGRRGRRRVGDGQPPYGNARLDPFSLHET